MVKRTELTDQQKRVYDACTNGWYMGGKYHASFDHHERTFYADSVNLLFREVEKWFAAHQENHANAHLLVKCMQAL